MRCCLQLAHTSLISSCILHSKGFKMELTPEEAEEMKKRLPSVIMLYLYYNRNKLPIAERKELEKLFNWRDGE